MNEGDVRHAPARVVDPELGLDIVELGLGYDVGVDAASIRVTMTLTTLGCPLHDIILDGVDRALTTPGGQDVLTDLVWEPAWSPERIGTGGRAALGGPTRQVRPGTRPS
jgi:metal-sulfur cluster biosynthetic enzyme